MESLKHETASLRAKLEEMVSKAAELQSERRDDS